MRHALFCLVVLLASALCCFEAKGQGCALSIQPNYSVYASETTDGTTIYTSVTIQGFATMFPSAGCNPSGATHQAKAYNVLDGTGGWQYGPVSCVSCYLQLTNNQSKVGNPGVAHAFNWTGAVVCSMAGQFFSRSGSANVALPSIAGPNTIWTFAGQSPAGYATLIQLTSSGGSSSSWQIIGGADKIHLSSTVGSTVTVSSTGTAFSSAIGDIHVAASIVVNGTTVTSAPFALTSRTPYRLVAGDIVTNCDANYGYESLLDYTMQDNLLATFPSAINVNENWTTGVVPDFDGTTWRRGNPGPYLSPNSAFADHIQGELAAFTPLASCIGPTIAVQHWGQGWYIGSPNPGQGTPVQNDTFQKYINSAAHLNIHSPVTAP